MSDLVNKLRALEDEIYSIGCETEYDREQRSKAIKLLNKIIENTVEKFGKEDENV